MIPLGVDESFFSCLYRPGCDRSIRRYVTVSRRLARLERLATDPIRLAHLRATGRDFRLCAAIAWASGMVEHARMRLEPHADERTIDSVH